MYNQFTYDKDSPHFHQFPGDVSNLQMRCVKTHWPWFVLLHQKFMVGLNFSSEREADKFCNAVEARIKDRQMRRTSEIH